MFEILAFFTKSLSGLSSLNSSVHSEPGIMTTSTPIQSPSKHKSKENKENKIMKFSSVVSSWSSSPDQTADKKPKKSQFYNAGHLPSFVFGKIKSLWSAHTTTTTAGLNFLADDGTKGQRKKQKSDAVEGTKISKLPPGMDHFSLFLSFVLFRFFLLFRFCMICFN